MPLHMTKIAFGAKSWADLSGWFEGARSPRMTTRYLPRRHEEMVGGSLYWILDHALVARTPINGFKQAGEGRWRILLAPRLVRVEPMARRAHQGWRYLAEEDAPRDLATGQDTGELMPGSLAGKLERLGLL